MEFITLLNIGRDLKYQGYNVREYLEKVIEFDMEQYQVFHILIENDVCIDKAIDGVQDYSYSIYDNFYEYIDSLLYDITNDLPNFIKLDYISMWYCTFRHDDNLHIDWKELKWCKDRDEYGTSEQKENQNAYIEYNLQYSQVIDFYY